MFNFSLKFVKVCTPKNRDPWLGAFEFVLLTWLRLTKGLFTIET